MTINTNPGQFGSVGGGEPLPSDLENPEQVVSTVFNTQFIDESEIQASENNVIVSALLASVPELKLEFTNSSNSLDSIESSLAKFGESIFTTYKETMNAVLDNWSKQIEEQAIADKESAQKERILENDRAKDRIENAIIKNNIKNEQIIASSEASSSQSIGPLGDVSSIKIATGTGEAVDVINLWNRASPEQRSLLIQDFGEKAVAHFQQTYNDPAIQNFELSKAIAPISMFLTQQFEINPLAAEIAIRSYSQENDPLISNISMFLPDSIANIPRVNLMVPLPFLSALVETNLSMVQKNKLGDKALDEAFLNEFAKKTLGKVKNIGEFLALHNPIYFMLNEDQKKNLNIAASLTALTTVLIFDVKVQAQFSNLTAEEFKSILKNGIPQNDLLNQVVQQINLLLNQMNNQGQKTGFINFLLNFIDQAKVSTISHLKSFTKVLMYANSVIGPNIRAGSASN